MNKSRATEVFNEWAQNGKDQGMQKNHFESYKHIKKIIQKEADISKQASFADIGCGNGWASGDILKESFVSEAYGYDGAPKMIENATKNIQGPIFFQADLNNWNPNKKFDIIYSMEVLYYLDSPEKFINECYNKWLNPNGLFIAGIDHYEENPQSLSWSEDLNVNMKTKKIEEWKKALINSGFNNVGACQVNQNKDWKGTLIFWGKTNSL